MYFQAENYGFTDTGVANYQIRYWIFDYFWIFFSFCFLSCSQLSVLLIFLDDSIITLTLCHK